VESLSPKSTRLDELEAIPPETGYSIGGTLGKRLSSISNHPAWRYVYASFMYYAQTQGPVHS
jgi:hypothetical protein